jgi:hypothetical protein
MLDRGGSKALETPAELLTTMPEFRDEAFETVERDYEALEFIKFSGLICRLSLIITASIARPKRPMNQTKHRNIKTVQTNAVAYQRRAKLWEEEEGNYPSCCSG